MITWKLNNGSFECLDNGEYVGLVSQNPPDTWEAGKWSLGYHPTTGGLLTSGQKYYDDPTVAMLILTTCRLFDLSWSNDVEKVERALHQAEYDNVVILDRAKNYIFIAKHGDGHLPDTGQLNRPFRALLIFLADDEDEVNKILAILPTPWDHLVDLEE